MERHLPKGTKEGEMRTVDREADALYLNLDDAPAEESREMAVPP